MTSPDFSDVREAACMVALEAALLALLRRGAESGEFDQLHIAAQREKGGEVSIDLSYVHQRIPVGGFSL
jgi:hypothetical protein